MAFATSAVTSEEPVGEVKTFSTRGSRLDPFVFDPSTSHWISTAKGKSTPKAANDASILGAIAVGNFGLRNIETQVRSKSGAITTEKREISAHNEKKTASEVRFDAAPEVAKEVPGATPVSLLDEKRTSLRLATWNIWFEKVHAKERYRKILQILGGLDLDVVCLQEVNRDFVNALTTEPWVKRGWFISDITDFSCNPYGDIIICRLPIKSLFRWTFPTRMSRYGLISKFNINGKELSVGTVHLESLDNASYRKQQLSIMNEKLSISPNSLLMGDFNIDDGYGDSVQSNATVENHVLCSALPAFVDVWREFYPTAAGFTFDHKANTNVDGPFQSRIDRVMAKLDSSSFTLAGLSMIGTESFDAASDEPVRVYPSDHFGLLVELKVTLPV